MKKKQCMTYEEASLFVQNLGINSSSEYKEWFQANRPENLPSDPYLKYKGFGWVSWGVFLGNGKIADNFKTYLPYVEAKSYLSSFGFKSIAEYRDWWKHNKPNSIPCNANQTYSRIGGWISWDDFLSIDRKNASIAKSAGKWMSFEELKKKVISANVSNRKEYSEWYSVYGTDDIPSSPNTVYKKLGLWKGWNDFCGTKKLIGITYKTYEEAKAFLKPFHFKSYSSYRQWWRKQDAIDLPCNVWQYYKKCGTWVSMSDFFGNDNIKNKDYLSYEEAQKYVSTLGLRTVNDYIKWWASNKPADIPRNPPKQYKDKWVCWGDFLGSNVIVVSSDNYVSYEEAKRRVSTIGIKTQTEFKNWIEREKIIDVPKTPYAFYKEEWVSWPDFLNNGIVHKWTQENRMPFNELKAIVKSNGISSATEYTEWWKDSKIVNVPRFPKDAYKDEWVSWGDFLGTDYETPYERIVYSYDECKEVIKSFKINRKEDFFEFIKTCDDKKIPRNPAWSYRKEWTTWGDFLGTNRIANQRLREYKLSLLTENDIQKSPLDNRFFCLTSMEILSLIKAGVLPKDFLSIARTPRGSRARLEAIQTLVNELSSDNDENEEGNIGDETVDVESIETLEEIERIDEEDAADLVVDETTGLPVLDSRENILRNGDIQGIDKLDPTSENGKFIVVNTIQKWWQVISDDESFVDEIRNYHGSKFYDYIKEEFFKEYDAVMGMKNPDGYSLPFELYPYQKVLAHELENRSSYSLWLDMGGGKTYSCIFASRHNNLKNNIVIAPKSVLQESWVSSLYESFPDSKVVTFFGDSVDEFKVDGKKDYNRWVDSHVTVVRNIKDFTAFEGDYNYLLINYDKFSQSYAKALVERISDCYNVDYVILDETQKVKYRESTGDASERNKHVAYLLDKIRNTNPNVKVSALTGTPLINELSEVKSIVELATGEEVSGIKNNRINIGNVSEANKALVLNGFRYRPKINVKHVLLTPEIECSEELERTIRGLATQKSYYGELESALAIAKINSPEVIEAIKPGTIIYVLYPYKNNTATEIIRKVESLGFKVSAYLGCTPNKHEVFDDFVNGRTDVLVASSPISVGVNGLQNRSDRMIIISLPQTNADYEQLIKRIVRKRKDGSVLEDKDVTIIVPQIVLELNENDEGDEIEWSWDRSRMNALLYKKNLGDAVMDGDIQKVFRIDWNKLYRNAMKRFKEGIKDEVEIKKNKVVVEEPEETVAQRQRAVSVISETHRMANSSNHGTTHQRFIDNPDSFQEYHRAREISKASWVEDPVDYIAAFINEHYANKKIADLGCGTNKLSTLMRNGNVVKGFDHQQVDGHDEVIVADIADLTGVVADREMDIAVFCLSLWGQDYQDYFKEAHRILKNNGRVIVVEPNDDFGEGKRYGDETDFINTVERYGFYRMGGVVKRNNFTYFRFLKED